MSLFFSDVEILSEKYRTEFQGRHMEDIPEAEYLLAVEGFTKWEHSLVRMGDDRYISYPETIRKTVWRTALLSRSWTTLPRELASPSSWWLMCSPRSPALRSGKDFTQQCIAMLWNQIFTFLYHVSHIYRQTDKHSALYKWISQVCSVLLDASIPRTWVSDRHYRGPHLYPVWPPQAAQGRRARDM